MREVNRTGRGWRIQITGKSWERGIQDTGGVKAKSQMCARLFEGSRVPVEA